MISNNLSWRTISAALMNATVIEFSWNTQMTVEAGSSPNLIMIMDGIALRNNTVNSNVRMLNCSSSWNIATCCRECLNWPSILEYCYMLYAWFSMRLSQSTLQYGWNPSILISTVKVILLYNLKIDILWVNCFDDIIHWNMCDVVNWIHIVLINRTSF